MRRTLRIAAAIVSGVLLVAPASGEEWSPYYHGDAGVEASPSELERQAAVRRQVQLNDALRWRAGFPPANGVFYYPFPNNLESVYGYGPSHPFGPSVFTPWPYVPGDIWGYRDVPPSRQSIGQVEMQTGPNRWESRPVYATPLRDAPPPIVAPEEFPPPDPLPPPGGLREF